MGKKRFVVVLAILFVGVNSALAIGDIWDGGGGTLAWNEDANWDPNAKPTASTWAQIQSAGAHVQISTSEECWGVFLGRAANTEAAAATLDILPGADLKIRGDMFRLGWDSPAVVNQTGGNIEITSSAQWMSFIIGNDAWASYTISAGTAKTTTTGGISINCKQREFTQGACFLDIQGGTVTAGYLQLYQGGSGSTLNISTGGHLYLYGDQTGALQDYENANVLVGDNGLGDVQIVYDSGTDMTHAYVSEPMSVALLGLGGLSLLHRKH